jgi:hypothetical protein
MLGLQRITAFITITFGLVFCTRALAEISCSDLKYGTPGYHVKMDQLAKEAELPGNYWNRYHAAVVRNFCDANIKGVDSIVDRGEVKAKQAQAIAKVLGKDYQIKPRSETGETYGSSKQKFIEMGACSACADNIAQYYAKKPDSQCGKLARDALDGKPDAIKAIVDFPDYCKWNY